MSSPSVPPSPAVRPPAPGRLPAPETASQDPAVARQRAVLFVIVAAYLMVGVDSTVVNVALPDIQRDLGFGATGLSWVLNSYTLAFGGLLLLGGRVGDIVGRRRTLVAGVLLFAVSSLLGGLAGEGGLLLAARACQGVGAALVTPNTLALLTTHFPEGPRRHHALGVYSSMAGIGASVGLVLGGMLTSWASWRWALLINVPIGAGVAALLPRFVSETPRHAGRFDLPGALTGTAGTTALVYGFLRAARQGWGDTLTLLGFSAAASLLIGFVLVESRAAAPVVPPRLLADRDRAGGYAIVLLLPAGMFGAFYFLTLFTQQVLDYSPLRAGFAFLPMTLAMFTVLRFVPRLLGRLGPRPVLLCGTALLVGAATWLWRLRADDGYAAGLLGPLLLIGLGMGLSFVPLNVTVLARIGAREAGSASGLLQTLQWLGGTLGLAVLVTVYGTSARHATGSPEQILATGAAHAFGIGALVSLAALLVAALVLTGGRPTAGAGRVTGTAAAASATGSGPDAGDGAPAGRAPGTGPADSGPGSGAAAGPEPGPSPAAAGPDAS
ncbi:MFS transporter [Streptomyces sp. NPDC090306]|uniref:MFS transporter n=1 Tax=Streptomyces sp. NPDC090306 TaxID=3365961 RepID=UPI00381E1F8C